VPHGLGGKGKGNEREKGKEEEVYGGCCSDVVAVYTACNNMPGISFMSAASTALPCYHWQLSDSISSYTDSLSTPVFMLCTYLYDDIVQLRRRSGLRPLFSTVWSVIGIMMCLSVRPSDWPSVTRWYCAKRIQLRLRFLQCRFMLVISAVWFSLKLLQNHPEWGHHDHGGVLIWKVSLRLKL